MALIEQLRSRRVYLDSNVFIYAFENYGEYPDCAEVIRALVAQSFEGVTSEITLIEVLPKAVHGDRPDLADTYLQAMTGAAALALLPVTRDIILRAVALRSAARLNSLDALHIATAVAADCSILLTNDLRLRPPPHIQAIYLSSRRA